MRTTVRLVALGGAAALSLTLAACGGDSATSSASSASMSMPMSSASSASADGKHNPADVTFAQDMIVHHQGAIQMAQLAATQASTQEVKDLARRIEAAQGPEIQDMTAWLKAWGQPITADGSMGSMSGMNGSSGSMGSGSMGSMGMTDEQMNQLKAATGQDFDRTFLQMMTAHHQSAIEMAKTEQANGSNPQAIALAKSIDTSQTAEVSEMAQMLKHLGS